MLATGNILSEGQNIKMLIDLLVNDVLLLIGTVDGAGKNY